MCDTANSAPRLAKEKSGMGERLTVIGASTGAMQALQIGVSYADMAQNFVAVTPTGLEWRRPSA
jgi:homoserine acetyltransferase